MVKYTLHFALMGIVSLTMTCTSAAEQDIANILPVFPIHGIHLGMTHEELLKSQPDLVSATLHPDSVNGTYMLHPGESPTILFQLRGSNVVMASAGWDARKPDLIKILPLKLREALQKAGKWHKRVKLGKLSDGDVVFEATGEFFDLDFNGKRAGAFFQANTADISLVIFDPNAIKDEGLYSSYQQLKADVEQKYSQLEAKTGTKFLAPKAKPSNIDFLGKIPESAIPRLNSDKFPEDSGSTPTASDKHSKPNEAVKITAPPIEHNERGWVVWLFVVLVATASAAWVFLRKSK